MLFRSYLKKLERLHITSHGIGLVEFRVNPTGLKHLSTTADNICCMKEIFSWYINRFYGVNWYSLQLYFVCLCLNESKQVPILHYYQRRYLEYTVNYFLKICWQITNHKLNSHDTVERRMIIFYIYFIGTEPDGGLYQVLTSRDTGAWRRNIMF